MANINGFFGEIKEPIQGLQEGLMDLKRMVNNLNRKHGNTSTIEGEEILGELINCVRDVRAHPDQPPQMAVKI